LAGGLWLMIFALRQLIAALLVVPGGPTLARLQHLEPAPAGALARLIDTQSRSLAVLDSAGGWSNLGLALALQSETSPAPERAALLGRAEAALRTSVSLAPANPYVWTRLAIVRQTAGADDGELLGYLRLSWLTGPSEERLRVPRIRLVLGHWGALTEKDRQFLFRDIRDAWAWQREDVLPVADTPFAVNVVRAALVPDPASLTAFDKALAARRGR
jgi:hypothetical protein